MELKKEKKRIVDLVGVEPTTFALLNDSHNTTVEVL